MIRRIIPYQIWKRHLHDRKLPSVTKGKKYIKKIGVESPRKADQRNYIEKEKRFINDNKLVNVRSNRKL